MSWSKLMRLWRKLITSMDFISMSASLGNFWRFPYTAYINGGGSFFIQYFLLYLLIGFPMTILNYGIGQFAGLPSTKLWPNLAPGWIGIGYTQCILAVTCLYYYTYHAALLLRYACNSWETPFVWGVCRKLVNTNNCVPLYSTSADRQGTSYGENSSTSVEQYLALNLLHSKIDTNQFDLGAPNFELCFYVGMVWICIHIIIATDITSYAATMIFTGGVHFLVIVILTVYSVVIPGAIHGLVHFVNPTWTTFTSIDRWVAALMQCYFTLNISCGVITLKSTQSKLHHNFVRTTALFLTWDTILSLLACVTVFGVMGHLSHKLKIEMRDVIKIYKYWSPYIAYSAGLMHVYPGTSVFAFIFYLTLCISTLTDMVVLAKILLMNLHEHIRIRSSYLLALTTITCSLLAMLNTTPEGTALATCADIYGNLYCRAVIIPLQIIAVCYVYGLRHWCWDNQFMLRKPVNFYFKWTWTLFIPLLLSVLYFGSIISHSDKIYNLHNLPKKIHVACYVFVAISTLPILFGMFCQLIQNWDGNIRLVCRRTFNSDMWWPYEPKESDDLLRFRANKMTYLKDQRKNAGNQMYFSTIQPLFERVP